METGRYVPAEIIQKLQEKEEKTEKEEAILDKWSFLHDDREEKLQWLNTEKKLVEIDVDIRSNLNPFNQEECDVSRVLKLLQEMNKLLVTKLMLKKQPQGL